MREYILECIFMSLGGYAGGMMMSDPNTKTSMIRVYGHGMYYTFIASFAVGGALIFGVCARGIMVLGLMRQKLRQI